MKKRTVLCMAVLGIVLAGITGCGATDKNADNSSQETREVTSTTAQATTQDNAQTKEDSVKETQTQKEDSSHWKKVFTDYINNTLSKEGWTEFQYIYLDADDIPELVAAGSYEAQGNKICTYKDGKISTTQLARLNFNYIPKSGLLCNSDGNIDVYYDIVYELKNGKMTQIHKGDWGAKDNSKLEFDANGNVIYQYAWDGVQMTEAEYKKALNAVFDTTKAEEGILPDNTYTVTQIIDILTDL